MGQQIIKQPDGKLAVFSTVVEAFIVTDATAEELVEWRAEEAAKEAREQTRRQVRHVLADEPERVYARRAMTWEEASQVNEANGGEPLAEEEIQR